jgi:conjugal transfer pilus assembly protein TraB
MMLDDLTQLPNRVQFNAKECRLIGAAKGDLSSERAHIRLETLSCVDEFDVVHEMKAKGYVFGEDGKPGVRGRLVSKQGQLLANALLAGIGSGMGQIIGQQSMIYNQTALGTTTTVNPNTVVQGGLGIGVSRAMERLAQYYIKMAEKIFPIIEVDAGRVVDIAFTGGVDYLEDVDTKGGGLVGLINPQESSAQQAQPANIQQQIVQQMMQQQMMMNNPNSLSNSNFD